MADDPYPSEGAVIVNPHQQFDGAAITVGGDTGDHRCHRLLAETSPVNRDRLVCAEQGAFVILPGNILRRDDLVQATQQGLAFILGNAIRGAVIGQGNQPGADHCEQAEDEGTDEHVLPRHGVILWCVRTPAAGCNSR